MIMSGLWIYWAYDPYRIGLGDITLVHMFPDWFYKVSGIDRKLAFGMAIHFVFAWLFMINGFVYAAYTLFSGEWRELVPNAKCFREALAVVKHDLGSGSPTSTGSLQRGATDYLLADHRHGVLQSADRAGDL